MSGNAPKSDWKKKFKKTFSKENIKNTFSKKPSKEKLPAVRGEGEENVPPPPPAPPLPQTALKDKTPEPKSHPKSPLAAVEAMKSTPFKDSPKKRRIDVTKSPSPPVVNKPSAPPLPKISDDEGEEQERSGKGIASKCVRVLGAGVAVLAVKAAISAARNQR